MSRPLRIEYDGALYHITSRGNARKSIFAGDEGRKIFLDTLDKVNGKYNFLCHAYCLMDNHCKGIRVGPRNSNIYSCTTKRKSVEYSKDWVE